MSRFSSAALRYGVVAMCCSMLHSLFTSFYVDYFVRVKLRSQTSSGSVSESLAIFSMGQLAYAMWNGLNDVGFGWCNDQFFKKMERRRFNRIAVGGPLWALVFSFLWLPNAVAPGWLHPAVTFSLMMILYDGFFSYTCVAFRALLADISTNPRERESCNAAAAVFHVVGSIGVGFAGYLYESSGGTSQTASSAVNESELAAFRWFTTLWAIAAGGGFVLATVGGTEIVLKNPVSKRHRPPEAAPSILGFAKQTVLRQSMLTAVVVWAVQEYSCTFATNFFAMFLAMVCGDVLSVAARSSLLMFSFVAPHVVTLLLTPLMSTLGKKRIVGHLFLARAVVGFSTILLARLMKSGYESRDGLLQLSFASALLLNRILTEAVCRLQGLILSDVTDEDTVAFARQHSMSASVSGIMSLVSKPFQSLAPVVTCYFLASRNVLAGGTSVTLTSSDGTEAVTVLLGVTSFVSAAVMWVVWQEFYPLDGAYLQQIQVLMKQRQDSKLEDTEYI